MYARTAGDTGRNSEQEVSAGPPHDVAEPKNPSVEISPAIEMNDAADIQSEPVAMPL